MLVEIHLPKVRTSTAGREHFVLVTWHHSVVSQLFYPHLGTFAKVLEKPVTETQHESAVDVRELLIDRLALKDTQCGLKLTARVHSESIVRSIDY